MRAEIRVSKAHERPGTTQARMERVLRSGLGRALSTVLELADDDPTLWLVRRLELDALVDARASDDAIAGALARRLANEIQRALAAGGSSESVARFDDRAHWYASYVRDVAEGRDVDRWYYAELDGLAPLPREARIRDAILRDAELAWPILARLARDGALATVMRATDARAAAAILGAIGERRRAALVIDDDLIARALAARRAASPVAARIDDPRQVLMLGMALAQSELELADLIVLVERLARAAEAVRSRTHDEARRLAAILAGCAGPPGLSSADLAWLHAVLPAVVADLPAWREAGASAERLESWLEAAPSLGAGTKQAPVDRSRSERWVTAFGHSVLLLPELAELHVEPSELRFAVLVAAAGHDARLLARTDATLAALAGLPRPPDRWEPPDARGALEGALALERKWRRVRGRVAIEPAGAVHVARDTTGDHWIDADAEPDSLKARLVARGAILVDGSDPLDASYFERRHAAADDLAYLAGPDPRPAELPLYVLARLVARSFSRRLMGMEWSRLSYVRDNFFPGACAITVGLEELVADLPPVPLALLLRMAGYDDRANWIPWLERTLRIRLSD